MPELPARHALIEHLEQAGGKISLRDYMGFCLSDPIHGYYRTQKPLGKQGDFITAPEISQIFGELIGLWFMNAWEKAGCPTSIALLELGPGRGLLMADILRTFKMRPTLLQALEIHQVEINPYLQKDQCAAISPLSVQHHRCVEEALQALEGKTTYIIANEFFDAFPIDQYVYKNHSWHKRYVAYHSEHNAFMFQDTPLAETLGNCTFPLKPSEGTIMESAPLVENLFRHIVKHLETFGGAGLIIDYGYDKFGYGDTLQALEKHQHVSPLEKPGHIDLTVHVNFATLLRIAQQHKKLQARLDTQGDFLSNHGIDVRTNCLAQKATASQVQQDLLAATHRLIHPDQMGTLFKVLQIET